MKKITWSPYATNIIDYINNPDLVLGDGVTPVTLKQSGIKFIIEFTPPGRILQTWTVRDNLAASAILNHWEVGLK